MSDMAVDAAVGHEAVQMQRGIILFAVFHSIQQGRIFKKGPVLDFLGNSGQFLIYNTACAHVQMAHLRIAHLSVRKSDCHAAGISPDKGAFRHQLVHYRSFGFCHGIAVLLFIQPIAVKNH